MSFFKFKTRLFFLLQSIFLLLTSTNSLAEHYWHQKNFGKQARQAIMRDLYQGNVSGAQGVGGQYHRHPLYKAYLYNRNTQNGRQVFVKPHDPNIIFGNGNDWDNPIMEAVAHKLDVMLRGGYIPPASIRRWLNIGGQTKDYCTVTNGVNHVISSWGQDLNAVRPYNRELAASELAIRAALLKNGDVCTPQNTVIGDHWVDGARSVAFFDWAGSFRGEHRLQWDTGIMRGQDIQHFNLATYQALKKLDYNKIKSEMRDSTLPGGWLADWQINHILTTRDGIVRHIDELVKQRGAENVFFRKANGQFDPGPYGWLDQQ